MPEEPFYRCMEACYNCGTIFCTPVIIREGVDEIFICPNSSCGYPETQFFDVSDLEVRREFAGIVGRTFSPSERMFLRGVSETSMPPSDKTDGRKWEQG
jgi:hypothetical protein